MPPAPVFNDLGHRVRSEWDLDPGFLTVNHGSYGATPRRVIASQRLAGPDGASTEPLHEHGLFRGHP